MTKPYRLPTHVRPTRYDIHLRARVGEPTFRGHVAISLQVERPTDVVELHGRDVKVLRASARDAEARVAPDADAEMMTLRFPHPLPPGETTLEIEYEGKISANMEGLYLSRDGDEQALATQCEETDARAIFPCFDEPWFKARFTLAVTTSPDVTVLANGPLLRIEDGQEEKTWRFGETKPMSTYLFATCIGRFAATAPTSARGVPMRVYAMEGKEKLGAYGLDFAARLLPWFEDYFGARYHFDKYDQVAVPSFSAGAMENSGLVIFRQTLLLRDPRTTSWQQEKLIARVIAHEFAHQWFGNLVTMAWWDDIWLNESFAEWMAHKAADAVAPDYRFWDDFHDNKREALVTDALATTHAIYTMVETPEQATELFDAVTYSKGSVLMRMTERFLGEEAFRAGLRTYMGEFAEKNAKGDDLWRHLGEASGQPVARLLGSWILQPGFPLVSVELAGTTLALRQRRFFSKPGMPDPGQTWSIPLVVRYADDAGVHEAHHLLESDTGSLALPARGAIRWLVANADGVGFYRQELSADLRARLVRHVSGLSAPEQRDLLDDTWALVRNGSLPVRTYLETLGPVLAAARDHHVFGHAVGSLEALQDLVLEAGDDAALAKLRAWAAALLAPESTRLGYAPRAEEDRDDAERRVALLRGMAHVARDADAIAAVRALADREDESPEAVDPTLAGPAVNLAARLGDAQRHARHFALYEARRSAGVPPALSQRYLYSLALFEDPALVAATLRLLGEGRFPLEAMGPMLRTMLGERHARVAAWEHMKVHWKDVREKLGDMWTGFLVDHTGNLPPRLRDDVVRFYDANLHGVAQQSYARALEALDVRAEFERRVVPELVAWLKAR